ncbi:MULTISPECIES: hypothetical protein [unclassified Gordonia (in: high G+C Gram-positive bacteria)]|uniref:hypothetical protein n=2 Tax=Gordoniaceae TaxID=85026 RepID=UPI00071E34D5|nr:hypothetical protein AS181_21195 [Gordonia sp. SGD-V-85]MBR7193252.1 hypothetical protein [Gordonia sp. SCSIO 19800]SCC53977.1 hypothetical protein GA0061091_12450 [Gordonia sp. v-85]
MSDNESTVRRGTYFEEPIVIDERTTMILVSRRGFRDRSVAVGAYTVTEGATTWTPAVDGGRVALIGVITGLVAAALGSAAVLRQPPWPQMTIGPDHFPGH